MVASRISLDQTSERRLLRLSFHLSLQIRVGVVQATDLVLKTAVPVRHGEIDWRQGRPLLVWTPVEANRLATQKAMTAKTVA